MAVTLGIAGGTVGISAAHELLHRRHPAFRALAQAFMTLVTYPHFPVVHLQVHHPFVGTALDPGTSFRNEPLPAFLPRALRLAWVGAWRAEAQRLTRLGLPALGWRSRLVQAVALQVLVLAGVALLFGPVALLLFLAQSVMAVFLTLTIDYTQHYGVERREVALGRLERFRAEHAWTAPQASNRSTFNLGLHADHHLVPARRYAALDNAPGSLQAPFGYPGLFLLALVPPLWFRVMNRRLPPRAAA
jgi:alkane 1-monooxygenase